jgi:hypothetical protein
LNAYIHSCHAVVSTFEEITNHHDFGERRKEKGEKEEEKTFDGC